jgi:hypothetical protein
MHSLTVRKFFFWGGGIINEFHNSSEVSCVFGADNSKVACLVL